MHVSLTKLHSFKGKLVGFRHSVHFHLRYRSVSYLSIRVVVICAVNFQLYPLRRCKLRNLSWVYSAVSHSLKAFTGRRKLLKVAPNVFLSILLIQILSFKARKLKLCMQPLLNWSKESEVIKSSHLRSLEVTKGTKIIWFYVQKHIL